MADKLTSNTNMLPVDDRTGWSFGKLLKWHFERGTRPGGTENRQGKEWGVKQFAAACGYKSDRTIRYWLNDKTTPSDLATVEARLFGADAATYTDWRSEFRQAFHKAQEQKFQKDTSRDNESAAVPGTREEHAAPITNILIQKPTIFIGRDGILSAIDQTLGTRSGRVALHGLRGIGKTTLAVAYAERYCSGYLATWWVRAYSEPLMRADIVELGSRLGWIRADERQEAAFDAVMHLLRQEKRSILLIFDNAHHPTSLKAYLPRAGSTRAIITSNFHAWRGVAEPIEVDVWSAAIGADYLVERTGRRKERSAAEALSVALGGLPLAHEQAAGYCERISISLADYLDRFQRTPAPLLDRDAPSEHNDGMTAWKSFTLGMEEAAKVHIGAEPLIAYASLLAPEPIPTLLFSEAREKLLEPFASGTRDQGLEDAIAALLSFALISRAEVADERHPTVVTDTLRLHRLVREIAGHRVESTAKQKMYRALVEALAEVYPEDVFDTPSTWPQARRLDEHCRMLTSPKLVDHVGIEEAYTSLLDRLASYRQAVMVAYEPARILYERALAIRERALGPTHALTATSLHNLARLLRDEGRFGDAQELYERALNIREQVLGREHRATAATLNNLASLLQARGKLTLARQMFERALTIREKLRGPEHPQTAASLINVARILRDQAEFARALPFAERGLAIRERVLGHAHPRTAAALNVLASVLQGLHNLPTARVLFDRALSICENVLGPEHPYTATCLTNIALLFEKEGDLDAARKICEQALAIREKVLGPDHPSTATSLNDLGNLFLVLDDAEQARLRFERARRVCEKTVGGDHPSTATSLCGLGDVLHRTDPLADAERFFRRALEIRENTLGPNHPSTVAIRSRLDRLGARESPSGP